MSIKEIVARAMARFDARGWDNMPDENVAGFVGRNELLRDAQAALTALRDAGYIIKRVYYPKTVAIRTWRSVDLGPDAGCAVVLDKNEDGFWLYVHGQTQFPFRREFHNEREAISAFDSTVAMITAAETQKP